MLRGLIIVLLSVTTFQSFANKYSDLMKLTIEELMNIKVTSVSKVDERWKDAPASIFVISREDILLSGVSSIPEALRLAPGVEVAQSGNNSWNISIRGFNNDLSNKLLVLMDGRSVYSPLFSGVFWDVQDTLLEDIERIEIISGPGGTLWGANAVNGVINIITRSSADIDENFVQLGTGTDVNSNSAMRLAGNINENTTARAYIKYRDFDASRRADELTSNDQFESIQAGFRIDRINEYGEVRIQGDAYSGEHKGMFRDEFSLGTLPGPSFSDKMELHGGNLMVVWDESMRPENRNRLQVYYDYTKRDIPGTYEELRHTFDVEWHQQKDINDSHSLIWGGGFRMSKDKISNTLFATFTPDERTDKTYSVFAQDKIKFTEKLYLTLGSKFEHNEYTGFEYQPNVRISWIPDETQSSWLAVSRAVRIPSRLDSDLTLTAPLSIPDIPFPVYVIVNGNDEFFEEELIAFESGWRKSWSQTFTSDMSVFYHQYDDLQTSEPEQPILVTESPGPYIVLPNFLYNGMEGNTSGGSMALSWQPNADLRFRLQYSYITFDLNSKSGSLDTTSLNVAGESPENQIAVHSFWNITPNLHFYAGIRYVDELKSQSVKEYVALDTSLQWQLNKQINLSLTVNNVSDRRHVEYVDGNNVIPRNVLGKVTIFF